MTLLFRPLLQLVPFLMSSDTGLNETILVRQSLSYNDMPFVYSLAGKNCDIGTLRGEIGLGQLPSRFEIRISRETKNRVFRGKIWGKNKFWTSTKYHQLNYCKH